MSGSAVADVGGIGHLCYRAMIDEGYDEGFSAATTVASSIIGPIIPPSIPMIIYAMVSGASVGKLFFGGAIPGLIFGGMLMIYIYFISKKRRYPKQRAPKFRNLIVQMLASFVNALLPLLTPLILLGCIYSGVVTVTEAAILAMLYTCVLGSIVYRKLGASQFIAALKSVFKSCAPILIIIPAAKIFGYVLTAERVQVLVSNYMLNFTDSTILILIIINLLFLILGCLTDPVVNIMLFVPIILPLASRVGIDSIHIGVIIVFNCMVGLATPPVGLLLMTVSSLEKIKYEELARSVLPYIVLSILMLVLLSAIPQITLFLPNLLFK
jgi:tripartite ATP-independent transporter DctM subunit